jgi:hypothetical protein
MESFCTLKSCLSNTNEFIKIAEIAAIKSKSKIILGKFADLATFIVCAVREIKFFFPPFLITLKKGQMGKLIFSHSYMKRFDALFWSNRASHFKKIDIKIINLKVAPVTNKGIMI